MTAESGESTLDIRRATDDFDQTALGPGWAPVGTTGVVFGFDVGHDGGAVAATCTACHWTVVMLEGDDPIPHGDPQLCEHMGGPAR